MSVDAEIQEVNESQTDKVKTNLVRTAVKCILSALVAFKDELLGVALAKVQ